MSRHLPAELVGYSRHLKNVFPGRCEYSAIARVNVSVDLSVRSVGLAQIGRAGENAAVKKRLQGANAHPIASPPRGERNRLNAFTHLLKGPLQAHHPRDVTPHGQFAASLQLLIGPKSFRVLEAVDHTGEACLV